MAASSMESIAVLSPRVTRVLGQNPGPFTLQGTNTYLIAPQASAAAAILPTVLIDTGDGEEAYIPLLERTLRGAPGNKEDGTVPTGRRYITEIALSHRHHDHIDGLPNVLALLGRLRADSDFSSTPLPLPRLHKKPDAKHDPALIEVLQGLPADSYEPYAAGSAPSPLWPLKADDVLSSHREGSSLQTAERISLQVVETPGHTADHLCFLLKEERTLFTADHVLGQGTTVFEDLNAYIDSLTRCSALLEQTGPSVFHASTENRLYPGHGPVVERGRFTLKQYTEHRLEREAQILELLATPSPSKQSSMDGSANWSLAEIVGEMYAGFPEGVLRAAGKGIFLHLHRLATNDWPKSVARVKCLKHPEYARGTFGKPPRLPEDMEEWEQVGESRWCLIKRAAI
ncbi:hypothetical protein OC842_005191 [Tilletia horrida]|uniref:Metallo-beta-lactamase domain-containing protein n=1 Tax=Tilletia horrida TaxID=155126 RepID=A0AAN6G9J3_9BASI|nr:hypothetical protein OC842_005191 [Tilletia horrida]